jgi:hypothetical protein
LLEQYSDLVKSVPKYERYSTVDELDENSRNLAKRFPGKVKYYQCGVARNGEPIRVLKIGEGKLNALLYGFPHANEPVGSLMIDHFAKALAEDDDLRQSLGFTWYLVKAIDVVGARRNEGWFSQPHDPAGRALSGFRWPQSEEVEWTFPVEYKTMHWTKPPPETRTLMRLQCEIKFDFINCLQDQGAGGVMYCVSDPCPELYAIYQEIAMKDGLQLHQAGGSWYSGTYIRMANGIYKHGVAETYYDYIVDRERMIATGGCAPLIGSHVARGINPEDVLNHGTPIFGYAKTVNPNVFVHQCEVSRGLYHTNNPKYYSFEESDATLADVSLSLFAVIEEWTKSVEETYQKARPYLTSSSVESMDASTRKTWDDIKGGKREAETDPLLRKKATWGEKLSIPLETELGGMMALGRLFKILQNEYWREGSYKARLEPLIEETKTKMEQWHERMKRNEYKAVPIRDLVACELAANIAAADYLRKKSGK